YWIAVNRDGLAGNNFAGGYVEGSWTLTGERRLYNAEKGAYYAIVPARPFSPWEDEFGIGALELAARYSTIDLNDKFVAGAPRPGERSGRRATDYLCRRPQLVPERQHAFHARLSARHDRQALLGGGRRRRCRDSAGSAGRRQFRCRRVAHASRVLSQQAAFCTRIVAPVQSCFGGRSSCDAARRPQADLASEAAPLPSSILRSSFALTGYASR